MTAASPVAQECDKPKTAAAAVYSSPPCYAHEFPGWFGEADPPDERPETHAACPPPSPGNP